jgi:hypothetical protein
MLYHRTDPVHLGHLAFRADIFGTGNLLDSVWADTLAELLAHVESIDVATFCEILVARQTNEGTVYLTPDGLPAARASQEYRRRGTMPVWMY